MKILTIPVLTLYATSQVININKFYEKQPKFIPPASADQPHRHTLSKMAANYSDVATVKDVDVIKWCYTLHCSSLHLIAIYHFYDQRLAVITD